MDEILPDKIKKALISYEKRIEETEEHYDKLTGVYGRYPANAPYRLKHLIPFWIHLLEEEKKGGTCGDFQREYDRITLKLTALEQKKGRDFRQKLLFILINDVDSYPAIIDSFADLDPFELEIPQSLSVRRDIEILLMELEGDYDLTEIKAKVSSLDKELKRKYIQNIEEILESYFDAEDPYSPESFWWNHPQKLLKEKQAMQNKS